MGNNQNKKDDFIENNQVTVIGEIVSGFNYSHEIFGEGFYTTDVKVQRLSEQSDTIPIMVSERLVDINENFIGQFVEVTGQFRSYNRHEERKNRLILSVFARDILVIESLPAPCSETNHVYLDGYLCKEPVYRKTPLGREICDLLLAVNRPYGKSDYIPCICWGRNARFAGDFKVSEHILVNGRIQSREYMKKLDEENVERRVAYEVSVTKIASHSGDDN